MEAGGHKVPSQQRRLWSLSASGLGRSQFSLRVWPLIGPAQSNRKKVPHPRVFVQVKKNNKDAKLGGEHLGGVSGERTVMKIHCMRFSKI